MGWPENQERWFNFTSIFAIMISTLKKVTFDFSTYSNIHLTDVRKRVELIHLAETKFKELIGLPPEELADHLILLWFDDNGKHSQERKERFFFSCCFEKLAKRHNVFFVRSSLEGWWCASCFTVLQGSRFSHFHLQLKKDTQTVFKWRKLCFLKTAHWKFYQTNEKIEGEEMEIELDEQIIDELISFWKQISLQLQSLQEQLLTLLQM